MQIHKADPCGCIFRAVAQQWVTPCACLLLLTVPLGINASSLYRLNEPESPLQIERLTIYAIPDDDATANATINTQAHDNIHFPARNVAEALKRQPGVTIQQDQGEGRFVSIRGLGANLSSVSLDSVNLPSSVSGERSVALDVLPNEIIDSLALSTTITAAMDADAIAGHININGLSGLDRAPGSFTLAAQGSHNELSNVFSPKLSTSYSDQISLGQNRVLGLVGALSWSQRDFHSHNMETDGGWSQIESNDYATGKTLSGFGAEQIEQRLYQIERERKGLAFNLDYKHNSNHSFFLHSLISRFDDKEFRVRNEYQFDEGQIDSLNWFDHAAQYYQATLSKDSKDRTKTQYLTSVTVGGKHNFHDWDGRYQLSYAKAREQQPNEIATVFIAEGVNMGYRTAGPTPTLFYDATIPENRFQLNEVTIDHSSNKDKERSVKLDVERTIPWFNHTSRLQLGGKWRRRSTATRVDSKVFEEALPFVTVADFSGSLPDFSLGDFGPSLSQQALRDFVSINELSFRLNKIESTLESESESFTSTEDIVAYYAMLTVDSNSWLVSTGVRFESTSYATNGNRVELVEGQDDDIITSVPERHTQDYEHWFPNLNLRYWFSSNLTGHFAYTETLARPSFTDAAARLLIETQGEDRAAEAGNPALQPYDSKNLDLSVDYAFSPRAQLSAGVFTKAIKNYIQLTKLEDLSQWPGFTEVTQATNGDTATLRGVELSGHRYFTSGWQLGLNATWLDTKAALPDVSDSVVNLLLGYEAERLSGQLSVTHKGRAFQFYEQRIGVYQAPHTQVELSLQYGLNANLTLYFNGLNLTDEPLYWYHGGRKFNYQYERYGRTLELGVKWSIE